MYTIRSQKVKPDSAAGIKKVKMLSNEHLYFFYEIVCSDVIFLMRNLSIILRQHQVQPW